MGKRPGRAVESTSVHPPVPGQAEAPWVQEALGMAGTLYPLVPPQGLNLQDSDLWVRWFGSEQRFLKCTCSQLFPSPAEFC